MEKNNLPIILNIENAKIELTNCVNNLIQKYNLDISIVNLLINELNNNVKNQKNEMILKEMSILKEKENENIKKDN